MTKEDQKAALKHIKKILKKEGVDYSMTRHQNKMIGNGYDKIYVGPVKKTITISWEEEPKDT